MAFQQLETRIPTSLGPINARFFIFADPEPRTEEVTTSVPVMTQKMDDGRAVWLDENGDDTLANTGDPALVQATDPQTGAPLFDTTVSTQMVLDAEGNPSLSYATAKIRVDVLDQNGQKMDEVGPVGIEELTPEQGQFLIMALMDFRHKKAAEMGIAPSPGSIGA